jgi:hypothetical protein
MKTRHVDCNTKAPARMVPAVGLVFSVSCYIYFKGFAGGSSYFSQAVFFLCGRAMAKGVLE